MSVKAKSKTKPNHESDLAEAVAIAGAKTEPMTAEPATATEPEATSEAAACEPLRVRLRVASTSAVVRSFAALRAAQATAVERTLSWVSAFDATLTRSLATGEQFLLGKLRPPPAS